MISKKEFNKWATEVIDNCFVFKNEDRGPAAFVHLSKPFGSWFGVCSVSEGWDNRSWRKEVRQFLLSNTNILYELHNRI